jgi:transcriptional regulator with XRE-family HTH domain
MEKDVYSFWEWVQRKMDELGISSFRELERRANMSNGSISSRKNELKFPTVEIAEGLCRALRVDWVELWTRAGYVSKYHLPVSSDLEALDAELYHTLRGRSEEFKKALLKTAKAWGLYEDLKK